MDPMIVITLVVSLLSLVCVAALLVRGPQGIARRLEAVDSRLQTCEQGFLEGAVHARDAKQATIQVVASFNQLDGRLAGITQSLNQIAEASTRLQSAIPLHIEQSMGKLKAGIATEHGALRQELLDRDDRQGRNIAGKLDSGLLAIGESMGQMRTETGAVLQGSSEALNGSISELRAANDLKLGEIVTRTSESARVLNETAQLSITTVTDRLTDLKTTLDGALKAELGAIRNENSVALESMRVTVDEKLHATLEQRLGDSFKQVSERLELVHRGLGEMQSLATGVGDLRKVLTNVKTRGTWGEVQLGNLLDQILTAEQYSKNVVTKPGSGARVEFAIRFPGRSENGCVWLPIDAKFPLEDYQRLMDAQERVDVEAVDEAGKALEVRIKSEARSIREKYIEPPYTTDFAVLYLPIEGLYAEVLRRPGLADTIQREYKIVLCGPTTLAAMLNSFQMGFRTLAIEKRSSEVWAVLGTVKAEFGKFGEALAHTKKKLEEASNSIDSAERRNRVLTKRLDGVDQLAVPQPALLVEAVVESKMLAEIGDEAA
jgi:DNA recombination protein RmuC